MVYRTQKSERKSYEFLLFSGRLLWIARISVCVPVPARVESPRASSSCSSRYVEKRMWWEQASELMSFVNCQLRHSKLTSDGLQEEKDVRSGKERKFEYAPANLLPSASND